MKFPDYERVIYECNPLNEVICQLRFPSLLKVTSQQPVEFQERIKADYPILNIKRPIELPIPDESPDIVDLLASLHEMLSSDTLYTFASEDSQWQVSLSKDFISLSTKKYKKYEKFKDRLQYIIGIFEELYKPSSYIRIGLRYQDLILPSMLDIKPDWKKLIKQHLIPELHSQELASSVRGMQKVIKLEFDGGKANLRHGIVEVNDPDREIVNEEAEPFLIRI